MYQTGMIKIFDGLYIGDEVTARVYRGFNQDEEFMLLHHVSLVVNLTDTYLPNYYQHYEINYINVEWPGDGSQLEEICSCIERTHSDGDVTLIHGLDNLEPPSTLACIFIMHRFRWSLYKTLEYLNSRIQKLTLDEHSYQLLKRVEMELLNEETRLSYNWEIRPLESFQLVLRNTYLNCSSGKSANTVKSGRRGMTGSKKVRQRRVSWNLQQSKPKEQSNNKFESSKAKQQNPVKDKIMLSVRKILDEHRKKQNILTQHHQNQQTSMQQTLKKQKSNFTMISLKQIQKSESNATLKRSQGKVSLMSERREHSERKKDQNSGRMRTELSESSAQTNTLHRQTVKTEPHQNSNGKVIIDVRLPSGQKSLRSSCKSLNPPASKQKQNQYTIQNKVLMRLNSSKRSLRPTRV